jgi:hypothetical protein
MTPRLFVIQISEFDMEIRVRDRRLLRVWIQRSTGFRDFPLTLTAHHASPLMDGLGSFGTSPLHYRAYQNFGYRDFAICEGKVSCLLSFPDAETPKRRPTATCPFDGRRRPSAKINGHDLFGMINGHDQIPAFLNLIHILRHFGVSVIGISRLAKTRVLVLSFSRVLWTVLVVSRFRDSRPPVTQILCQLESLVSEIPMDSRSPPRVLHGWTV